MITGKTIVLTGCNSGIGLEVLKLFVKGNNRILAVEHSPIRELREYRVPLSYPRTESALAAPEALALKEQLIRLFREAGK